MKKTLIISILALLLSINVVAQEQTIKGQILDNKTQEPLIGATVYEKGSKLTGTTTDDIGFFELETTKERSVLVVSMVGYKTITKELAAEDYKKPIVITLSTAENEFSEVIVKGLTREELDAKEVKLNVNPVTIITAKEIENRASNLNELLARQAGVQIRQSGGAGSSSTVSVRGLEGKRVQIYIDGNPLNTPDGSFGINDLPLQIIERVEIYKGTIPAEFGGDGLGSAINVVTKHGEYSYIDGFVSAQSFGTLNAGFVVKKDIYEKGVEFGLGVFVNKSDNDYLMQSPFQSDLKIRRDHDYYRNVLIGGGITFHKLWFDEVEIEGAVVDYKRELQGIQTNIQEITTTSNVKVGVLNLEKENFLFKVLNFKAHSVFANLSATLVDTSSYSYNWDGTRRPSIYGKGEMGNGPNMLLTKQNEIRNRLNFNYQLNEFISFNLNNSFRRGYFNPHDDLANEYAGRNIYNWPANLVNNITGLTAEFKNRDNSFMGSAALKHYYSKVNGYNTNIYTQGEPDEVAANFNNIGYNLGLRYNLSEALIFKASHERALRMPNNQELFGDGLLITPSLNLRPEIAFNNNLGIVFDKFQYPSGNRFQIEANAFLMHVSDLIQLGGNGISIGYVNYAKGRIYGADLEIKKDLTKNLYTSVNATWQRVQDFNKYIPETDRVPNPTHKKLVPNIPTFFTNWNLEYQRNGLLGEHTKSRFIYEGSFTEEFNFGFALSIYDNLRIPSFLTHNIIWEQSFKDEKWVVTGEIRNIGDAVVLNNWNQPLPGRSFRVKLRCLLIEHNDQSHEH